MSQSPSVLGQCSPVDKFYIGHHAAGSPRRLAFLFSYPSDAAAPSAKRLRHRLGLIAAAQLILTGHIDDSVRPRRWIASDVPSDSLLSEETFGNDQPVDLLQRTLEHADIGEPLKAPLIHVVRYTSGALAETYIGIGFDHALTDAMGMSRLYPLLLNEAEPELWTEQANVTRIVDLLPCMPPPPTGPPEQKPHWPTVEPGPVSWRGCPATYVYKALSPDVVSRLSAQGKAHGVPTLSAILECAFAASLWHVLGRPNETFVSQTTKDERAAAGSGTTQWSGTWTSSIQGDFRFSAKLSTVEVFWHLARGRYAELQDADHLQRGRHAIGILEYVPDPFEDMLNGMSHTAQPWFASILFSNATRAKLPEGCTDFCWTSSATPFIAPIEAHLIGHEAGLRLVAAFYEGYGITMRQINETLARWESVLGQVAMGEPGAALWT